MGKGARSRRPEPSPPTCRGGVLPWDTSRTGNFKKRHRARAGLIRRGLQRLHGDNGRNGHSTIQRRVHRTGMRANRPTCSCARFPGLQARADWLPLRRSAQERPARAQRRSGAGSPGLPRSSDARFVPGPRPIATNRPPRRTNRRGEGRRLGVKPRSSRDGDALSRISAAENVHRRCNAQPVPAGDGRPP
jgi:hypothetical protein